MLIIVQYQKSFVSTYFTASYQKHLNCSYFVSHMIFMACNFSHFCLNIRDHLEEWSLNGKIILEWILRKKGRKVWTGYIWLGIGTVGRLLWLQ